MEDSPPLKNVIATFGTSAVAREMGLPVSTVHGWKTADKIPGRGKAHEWRVAQFVDAIERLKQRESGKARAA